MAIAPVRTAARGTSETADAHTPDTHSHDDDPSKQPLVRGFITEECRGANGERIGFDVVLIPAPPIGSDDATGVVQASRGPLAR